MKKHYLVTGGHGFIGAAIVRRLVAEGHRVRTLDNNSRGAASPKSEISKEVDVRLADIRDAGAVKKACHGVDSVVHLAYVNGTEYFYSKPELVLDVAIRGMVNVLEGARSEGVKELLLASSSEVYQTPPKIPTDESVALSIPDVSNPRYSYGGGKIISELMAINWGRNGFDRVVIFRPHNVYGPNMGWEHVLPQFIVRAKMAVEATPRGPVAFPIQGNGRQTRAFTHIDDFVDGFMCVLKKGEHLNIYHIGNPEEISIGAVARKVLAYFGRKVKLVPQKGPSGGPKRRCPDIRKLMKLGFRPKISLDQGLPSIADWYAAHPRP